MQTPDTTPTDPAPAPGAPAVTPSHLARLSGNNVAPCIACGYDLRGLSPASLCPECSKPVADSLRGQLLSMALPDWLKKVDTGLRFVLLAILISILLALGSMVVGIIGASIGLAPGVMNAISALTSGLSVLLQVLSAWGYFSLSEPDPGFTGIEKPDAARVWLRRFLFISVGVKLLQFAFGVAILAAPANPVTPLLLGGLGLLDLVASAGLYISMLLYARWLANRVPDLEMTKKIGRYLWLLPVLCTVGLLLLFLGPLIALILYYNLLTALRKHVTTALKDAQGSPGMPRPATDPPAPTMTYSSDP